MHANAHAPAKAAPRTAAPAAAAPKVARTPAAQPFGPALAGVEIGAPNDRFEAEAHRMADRVVAGGAAAAAGASVSAAPPSAQRACAACAAEQEQGLLQRDAAPGPAGAAAPATAPAPLASRGSEGGRSSGASLDAGVRAQMEQGFGRDFGDVRIHRDSRAHAMNRALHAKAFTYGADVYFGAGHYDPNSTAGRRLIAHELTHVAQQTGGAAAIQRAPLSIQATSISSWDFRNSGSTDAANCCAKCPLTLGEGVASSGFRNGMELKARINGHVAGTTYDIKRTIERATWTKNGGTWTNTSHRTGDDDKHDSDECLTPSSSPPAIFSEDRPGFNAQGAPASGDTDMVYKATFTEFVEITDPLGNTSTDGNGFDWHSISWLTNSSGSWTFDNSQSEIETGSVTVGTTAP